MSGGSRLQKGKFWESKDRKWAGQIVQTKNGPTLILDKESRYELCRLNNRRLNECS